RNQPPCERAETTALSSSSRSSATRSSTPRYSPPRRNNGSVRFVSRKKDDDPFRLDAAGDDVVLENEVPVRGSRGVLQDGCDVLLRQARETRDVEAARHRVADDDLARPHRPD